MPELKHSFQTGRMNKDLDERLVPNGEYRDALNIEVSTSEDSDIGSLQTTMGNTLVGNAPGGTCVGSIVNEKNDKLYYLVTATGIDFIAEYDHALGVTLPVCVDIHGGVGPNRVLNFAPQFPITGINIVDGMLFWTDNNSEPKRIHIERGKAGTLNFWTHTKLQVRNTLAPSSATVYMNGPPIREEHLTVIRISPPTAPLLEMKDTLVGDINADGTIGVIDGTVSMLDANGDGINPFVDAAAGGFHIGPVLVTFNTPPCPDYSVGDYLIVSVTDDPSKQIRVLIVPTTGPPPPCSFTVEYQSGDPDITSQDVDFDVTLEQVDPLFQFKFPRFGYRYKYEDGEYSTFSPFTEVAFLPGDFYYLPREGYNLGMVNNLRKLAIKDFVHERLIPDDVISIDILYKESNSPNIYSIKTVKRVDPDPAGTWDAWNADSRSSINTTGRTRGFLPIKSEMIHAVLPENQLLRPWDNVPRKALAQEITKNRLVYGNYLQNYNLFSTNPLENNIDVQLGVITRPHDITGALIPEQYNPADAYNYKIAKSVKSLRTYQVGVAYIDEYGRETPVFSSDKRGNVPGISDTSITSLYVDKTSADQGNKLGAHVTSTAPDWATAFKFFVKETSNEYYNLALDRWYDAEDGNVWLSFPSSERNKVDIETFLILKKEHDNWNFVNEPARYKILALENEAPPFVKTEPTSLGTFTDTSTGTTIGVNGGGGTGWPFVGDRSFFIDTVAANAINWNTTILATDISEVYFRFRSPTTYGKWYKMLGFTSISTGPGYYEISTKNPFGPDMALTGDSYQNRTGGLIIEVVRRQEINKPEFEGRFFAKVVKDATLIKRIVKPLNGTNYIIEQSAMSSYINPEPSADPNAGPSLLHGGPFASAGVTHPNSWFGLNRNRVSIISSNQTRALTPGGSGQGDGDLYWDLAGNTPNSSASGWFIDKIEGFRDLKVVNRYWANSDNSWRTNPQNPKMGMCTPVTIRIGTVSAYDDNNVPEGMQVLGTGTHTTSTSLTGSYLQSGAAGPANDLFTDTSATGEIAPSVGIDTNSGNNLIHLSYSGIGTKTSGWGATTTNLSNIPGDFQVDMTKHTADLLFINELITPGTIWRWREDPGQVIYQTLPPQTTGTSTPQNNTQWAKNTYDTSIGTIGEPGITLYNYCNFDDYAVDNHHQVLGGWIGFPINSYFCTSWKGGWVTMTQSSPEIGPAVMCCENSFTHTNVGGWTSSPLGPVMGSGTHGGSLRNRFPGHVEHWDRPLNIRRRFQFRAEPYDNPGSAIGSIAPHFYTPVNDPNFPAHYDSTGTALTTSSTPVLPATPAPGIRNDGMHSGYAVAGSLPFASPDPLGNTEIPNRKQWDLGGTLQSTMPGSVTWEILSPYAGDDTKYSSKNPAIWETEPKEDVGLDIYHEVGQIYPIELNNDTIEQFVGPVHANLITNSFVKCYRPGVGYIALSTVSVNAFPLFVDPLDIRVNQVAGNSVRLTDFVPANPTTIGNNLTGAGAPLVNDVLIFVRANGGTTEAPVKTVLAGGWFELWENVDKNLVILPWHNCYSFGNGVESDRVRDDFNQVTIDNGPKASTTLEEPYLEERRASGLIYSGIYNSISGVNNLNQFVQAEKITKDLNPVYGSIQKLHARNTDLLTLCEDKVFKILANKDALYNADGNMNLTATANVLGQTIPLTGEYGISKNPESFASESYRAYFSDKTRGVILRLSQDGLTPISDYGMKDWFSDNLPLADKIIGSFDDKKQTYNVTLNYPTSGPSITGVTVSFTENVKGWPSFKSFIQEYGLSLNNTYYTIFGGQLWEHHSNPLRNNYYVKQYDSHVDVLFNDAPGSIKSFQNLNYEGTQARITPDINNNLEYYDNFLKTGWYVKKIMTILHQGSFATYGNWVDQDEFLDDRLDLGSQLPVHASNWHTDHSGKNTGLEFWDKEGKWFSQIKGTATEWLPDGKAGNIDTQEFSYQGIGNVGDIKCPYGCPSSWKCVAEMIDVNSCDGLIEIIPTTPFTNTEHFVQYLSDPNNGYTNSDPKDFYACIETDPSYVNPLNVCRCGTGILVLGFRVGFNSGMGYLLPESNYTTWDDFVSTLINDWDTQIDSTYICPIIFGMTYVDVIDALTIWSHTSSLGIVIPFIVIIDEPDPCVCREVQVCECIEFPGTQHHPTKSDCEGATNCC